MDCSRDQIPLCTPQNNLIAVVCDGRVNVSVPVFSMHQIRKLVDHLEKTLSDGLGKIEENHSGT